MLCGASEWVTVPRDCIQHSVVGGVLCFQTVQTAARKINIQLVVSPHQFQERPGVAVSLRVRETSDMQPAFCGLRVARLSYVRGSRQFPNTFNTLALKLDI